MWRDGIYVNYDNLIQITYNLKQKIKQIENCYNEIKKEINIIDGSNDYWQGDEQKEFLEAFEIITNKYDNNIKKMIEIYNYLCNVIIRYDESDEKLAKKAEENNNDLSM